MDHKTKISTAVLAFLLSAHASANAQGYDPQTQSPMSLLTVPADPIAYADARARVEVLKRELNAVEAEPLLEQVTREYPRDGENWILLGEARSALGKYAEAAAAFERGGELLGWGLGYPARSAAIAHMQAGNRTAALELLRRHAYASADMNRSGFYDREEFASLRTDPQFLEIAGRPDTTGWSRDYGWRQDVDFLRDEVRRLNAQYRTAPLPPEFERRYQALRENVPQLSDEQIFVEMNRMLAVLHQGHVDLTPQSDSRVTTRALPFRLWAFPEGIFIVAAAEQHRNLVGSRLISIAGVPAEEALRRLNETQSVDGDNEYIFEGVNRLRSTAYLVGLGIGDSTESVRIVVQRPGGSRRALTIGTPPFEAPARLVPPPSVSTPLYLRNADQYHWHEALPEQDALYVQLNGLAPDPDESLSQYALRLREVLAETSPKYLIVDMRHANGGSTSLYPELLRTMIGYSLDAEHHLYVLIGRRTYSAAANFVTELEQLANATFIGEATGECCTFYASPSPFILPYSRLRGRQPTSRINLSHRYFDTRRELNPHVPVMTTAEEYFAGRDPVMETVSRMIERDRAGAATNAQRSEGGSN